MALVDRLNGVNVSLALKAPVKVRTTANITLFGEQTIDGVALVAGNRVLVMNQNTGYENGVYTVNTGQWVRSPDWDGLYDITKGTMVKVQSGTLHAGEWYEVTNSDPVVGTTSITFEASTSAVAAAAEASGYADDAAASAAAAAASEAGVASDAADAETARLGAIAAQLAAVAAKLAAETAETNAETAETNAETAQAAAESAASTATAQANNASSSANDAQAAQVAAESARTGAETAETNAEAAAAALRATSTTSHSISAGEKIFTTQAGKQFIVGGFLHIVSDANPTGDYLVAQLTGYVGTTLTVMVTSGSGSGTHTDWTIGISGVAGAEGSAGEDGNTGPQGETGPAGPQGVQGPQGIQGDTGPQGPTGADGPTGPQGPTGDVGPAGADGADGRTILNGTGVPGAGLGANGDFYIDTAADTIYGPKTAGAWGSATSLIGPQGDTGPAGADGADGPAGADGADGINGTNGSDGNFSTYFTESLVTAAPNATVEVIAIDILTTGGLAAPYDLALDHKGYDTGTTTGGAFSLQIPDNLTSGGNKRGARSIDLSVSRTNAANVASGAKSIAIGNDSQSSGASSVSVGDSSAARGASSVAIGPTAIVAVAAVSAISIGDSSGADGSWSVSIGVASLSSSDGSIAIGNASYVPTSSVDAIAIGDNAQARAAMAIAIGSYAEARGINSIAIGGEDGGTQTLAYNDSAIAIGKGAVSGVSGSVTVDYTIAIGDAAEATGVRAVAIGMQARAQYNGATAVGDNAAAVIDESTAIGQYADAEGGYGAVALGANALAQSIESLAVGYASAAFGTDATALGPNSAANGQDSIALGNGANTNAVRATSIGYNSSSRDRVGNIALGNGQAQSDKLLMVGATTDATPKVLTSNAGAASSDNQIILPNNSAVVVKGIAVARKSNGDTKMFEFTATAKRGANAAATSLIAAATVTTIAADAGAAGWTLAVTADTTNGGLAFTATGQAASSINWKVDADSIITL